MTMRLLYVANARIPTEKAHGIAIMKACQAFVRADVKVTLVVANRKNVLPPDAHAFYEIPDPFSIVRLPTHSCSCIRVISPRTARIKVLLTSFARSRDFRRISGPLPLGEVRQTSRDTRNSQKKSAYPHEYGSSDIVRSGNLLCTKKRPPGS